MKLRWALIVTIPFLLSPALGAQTKKALASNTSGWIDILPDESFKGWTREALPPNKALRLVSQWRLDKARRIIICEGDGGHELLRYDRELANFVLHVEWRFTKREGLKGYNSGVFIRTSADARVWVQAQVGAGNDGFLFGQTLLNGELTPTKLSPKPKVNYIKPPDEWNTYEIRCEGPKITLRVNGEVSSEFETPEVPKGYLGLEAEGFRIEFRNLKLKTLP